MQQMRTVLQHVGSNHLGLCSRLWCWWGGGEFSGVDGEDRRHAAAAGGGGRAAGWGGRGRGESLSRVVALRQWPFQ